MYRLGAVEAEEAVEAEVEAEVEVEVRRCFQKSLPHRIEGLENRRKPQRLSLDLAVLYSCSWRHRAPPTALDVGPPFSLLFVA
jgi:hypothetical protein